MKLIRTFPPPLSGSSGEYRNETPLPVYDYLLESRQVWGVNVFEKGHLVDAGSMLNIQRDLWQAIGAGWVTNGLVVHPAKGSACDKVRVSKTCHWDKSGYLCVRGGRSI